MQARVTLKFDGWPRKIIGHLFCITSSFVHHLKSLGEFKLELLSGNAQFGSKLAIFLSRVTLKFDGWPWKTIGHLFHATLSLAHHFKAIGNSNWSYSPETLNSGQNGEKKFVPCALEIWWMTLKNNRTPLLRCFKFVHHFITISEFKLKLQSGNAQFGSKSAIYCPVWPWNLMDDLEKQ